MKKVLFTIILHSAFLILHSTAQQGQWTWMNGSNTSLAPAVYGTQGVPNANNTPQALYEVCDWVDTAGNFWLFGGLGGNERNDLWKYDPVSNQWTWMKGSGAGGSGAIYGVKGMPSPLNNPGGRAWGAWSFVDNNNNLWMYGGIGYDKGTFSCLSDLWKYDISTNEWTWMQGPDSGTVSATFGTKGVSGPNNTPGARAEADASWCDNNNNLWLFGGAIYKALSGGGGWSLQGFGNDLWKYDMGTNQWTWMKGSNLLDQVAVYGTKGTGATNNTPSARGTYTKWKDTNDNLWMFGGYNFFQGNLNDVWRYSVTANQWTWMSGPSSINGTAVSTGMCNEAVNNIPCSRYENRASAVDACGKFWTMGGFGGAGGFLNDLWKFDPATLNWTWINGNLTGNSTASFGTKGVPSPTNLPGGKGGAGGWMDKAGNFWVFGGMDAFWNQYNDMWRYAPDTCAGVCTVVIPPIADFTVSDSILCANDCVDYTDLSVNASSWQWTFSGGMPPTSTDQNPLSVCYLNSGIYAVKLVASNSGAKDSITVSNYIHVSATPITPSILQVGDSLKCSTDPGYTSYQWYYEDTLLVGASNSWYIATKNGNYNVKVTNESGCSIAVGINVVLNAVTEISDGSRVTIWPNPVSNELRINPARAGEELRIGAITIYNTLGEVIIQSEIRNLQSEITVNVQNLASGIYFVHITSDGSHHIGRFVKE